MDLRHIPGVLHALRSAADQVPEPKIEVLVEGAWYGPGTVTWDEREIKALRFDLEPSDTNRRAVIIFDPAAIQAMRIVG